MGIKSRLFSEEKVFWDEKKAKALEEKDKQEDERVYSKPIDIQGVYDKFKIKDKKEKPKRVSKLKKANLKKFKLTEKKQPKKKVAKPIKVNVNKFR